MVESDRSVVYDLLVGSNGSAYDNYYVQQQVRKFFFFMPRDDIQWQQAFAQVRLLLHYSSFFKNGADAKVLYIGALPVGFFLHTPLLRKDVLQRQEQAMLLCDVYRTCIVLAAKLLDDNFEVVQSCLEYKVAFIYIATALNRLKSAKACFTPLEHDLLISCHTLTDENIRRCGEVQFPVVADFYQQFWMMNESVSTKLVALNEFAQVLSNSDVIVRKPLVLNCFPTILIRMLLDCIVHTRHERIFSEEQSMKLYDSRYINTFFCELLPFIDDNYNDLIGNYIEDQCIQFIFAHFYFLMSQVSISHWFKDALANSLHYSQYVSVRNARSKTVS